MHSNEMKIFKMHANEQETRQTRSDLQQVARCDNNKPPWQESDELTNFSLRRSHLSWKPQTIGDTGEDGR